MTEVKTMKIGNGKIKEDGVSKKIRGYAPRAGKSLAALLKEHQEVKMVGMGDAASIIVKAIAHAQVQLKEEDRDLVATDFAFETVEMEGFDGKVVMGKVVTVLVKLV